MKKSNDSQYIKYNKLESYTQFVEYIIRRLGGGVVDINVSPEQMMDRISDAIQYYIEYDLESLVSPMYFIHKVTKEDVENGYLTISPDIIDVMEVLTVGTENSSYQVMSDSTTINSFVYGDKGFGADAYMSSFTWNWWNNYWMTNFGVFGGNQSMAYFTIGMQYVNAMKEVFTSKPEYIYRRRQRKLWLYSKELIEGDFICLQGAQVIDPESDDSIWDSEWLKAYATALVGLQWGSNLTKFSNIPSAGGLTINADGILARYQQEKAELEEKHRLQYEEPPVGFFGGWSKL